MTLLRPRWIRSTLGCLAMLCALSCVVPSAANAAEDHAFFEREIRPILVERCYGCHSEESGKQKGGLLLDRRSGWQTGGDSGPAIVPGDVDKSLLVTAIRYANEHLQMPPKSKLPAKEINLLERWVRAGASDPRDAVLSHTVRKGAIDFDMARRHWSVRPLKAAGLSVDQHIERGLTEAGLTAAPPAAKRETLRRLHYDLTGLPPSHAEVEAFEADDSAYAWERRVDELLARSAFGEKWGRHWLDIARYADSNGGDRNFTFHHAWRYRNWVIDAFNEDLSYYDFVAQQLAGDLLECGDDSSDHRSHHSSTRNALIASSFLSLGPKMLTERDKEKLVLDVVDEQVDTFGRAFLGLTFGCARCHDHKFDPVSQEDYYAMAGIFHSTETVWGTRNGDVNVSAWLERPLEENTKLDASIARLEQAMHLVVQLDHKPKPGLAALKSASTTETLGNPPFGGVIIDDADAEVVGAWRKSTHSKRFLGEGYLVHSIHENNDPKHLRFAATLPADGEYEVRVGYNRGGSNFHPAVPITVQTGSGPDAAHTLKLDQRKPPRVHALFQPIGRYNFTTNAPATVTITPAGGAGYVIVDAVQFISVADLKAEQEALLDFTESEQRAEAVAKSSAPKVPPKDSIEYLHYLSIDELKKEVSKGISSLVNQEVAMAPRDAKTIADVPLRIRGVSGRPGNIVPRGVPTLFGESAIDIPAGVSGRRELAEWLVSDQVPLLDRVMVNRVWHHLMGQGIVRTVDNFGALADTPSHPELLDDLATRFRANGGSVKSVIREIVLSETYQRRARGAEIHDADPENRLCGHQNRRRLSAEELRDSLLLVAGRLDPRPQGATARSYKVDIDGALKFADKRYRSVYLPVARNNAGSELLVFDMANPDLVSGARSATTVPTQALFLLQGAFVKAQAAELTKAVRAASGEDQALAIDQLYRRVLQRQPTAAEQSRAEAFLAAAPDALDRFANVLLASTEFQFLD